MAKKYWLGPGVYFVAENQPDIKPDEIISKKVLGEMGDKRVKNFEDAGRIGLAPESSVHIIAAKNIQKALKLSEKEKSKALNDVEKTTAKVEKLEAENKELKDKLKKLESENKSLGETTGTYKKRFIF